ncbi:MAG: bifunctional phosphopantothenoylcysteine decarboxylase/phosphopantothenate--cysteine ligase CoaBC, partial [Ignavibacteria bacterium]
DVFILAPATANTIAKIVCGMSDNFLTAALLASRCPIIIVPSMDEDMLLNEITKSNLSKLKEFGYFVLDPDTGELASGLYGIGRMPEPEDIFKYTEKFLSNYRRDLEGKKVLVTAGPTYEPIDDVRFIGNYSSGKMGFQIARAAAQRGAEVTLISGPTFLETPRHVKRIDVKTSEDMFNAVKNNYSTQEYIIMSAAVADFKPEEAHKGKLKKSDLNGISLQTTKTTDILEFLGKNKNGYKLIGFALETENELDNAKEKLLKKNLDMIVVNNPNIEGAGFGKDTNTVTLIDKELNLTKIGKTSKYDIANIILDKVID